MTEQNDKEQSSHQHHDNNLIMKEEESIDRENNLQTILEQQEEQQEYSEEVDENTNNNRTKQHVVSDQVSSDDDNNNGIKKGMFGRRAWDDHTYEQRAMDRMNRGANFDSDEKRKPSISRSEALQRKPLEAREGKLLTDNQVGKKGIVDVTSDGKQLLPNSKTKVKSKQKEESVDPTKMAGFYCKVCDRNFRDSHAYIDHCNTKSHLSRMGVSNRAVKATADDVKQKLQAKIAAKKANAQTK
ncbi:predicted protein [Naegleria gruberi]|uniref:Predicted protein n=1 Tax=Naegleria gruberi TaxID=5762 RepID=D2VAB8_NAEGR|nr:uncharacterized protein NAEGRDRAFT_47922 [Naegleria gruberi]EFC46401.1 predicted protein [Naegleria gruberi]|eukprot:XP_002679145.1 predicted protein [Naegleria gruberi strain NEG-M]